MSPGVRAELERLKGATNKALEAAKGIKATIPGAINWADLKCIDAQFVSGLDREFLRVVIDEAAPESWELQEFVRKCLKASGWTEALEIDTEW